MNSLKRRLERVEATSKGVRHGQSMALEVYLKTLDGIPLTPQERAWQEATENSPMMQAYWQELEQQREERLRRETLQKGVT